MWLSTAAFSNVEAWTASMTTAISSTNALASSTTSGEAVFKRGSLNLFKNIRLPVFLCLTVAIRRGAHHHGLNSDSTP